MQRPASFNAPPALPRSARVSRPRRQARPEVSSSPGGLCQTLANPSRPPKATPDNNLHSPQRMLCQLFTHSGGITCHLPKPRLLARPIGPLRWAIASGRTLMVFEVPVSYGDCVRVFAMPFLGYFLCALRCLLFKLG
jgi:hypothetical protein